MSNEIPPSQPTPPKTTEIAVPSKQEIMLAELRAVVVAGQVEIRGDLDVLKHEGQRTNTRLTRIEERVDEVEGRIGRNSQRVRESKQNDMAQDAQLAQERAAREELATKVDSITTTVDSITTTQATQLAILDRLDKVASNPHFKMIIAVIATALASWAASKGIK